MQPWDDEYTDTYRRITDDQCGYHLDNLRAKHVAELLYNATFIRHTVRNIGMGYVVSPVEYDNDEEQ